MSIKDIARQAAEQADMEGVDIPVVVPTYHINRLADAVAVAVLREVAAFGAIAAGSAARTLLAECSAPVALPPPESRDVEQAKDRLNDIISKYGEVLIEGETGSDEVEAMDAALTALIAAVRQETKAEVLRAQEKE